MTELILVNELDEPIGVMEKIEVHIKGELHRAFSIFVFNSKGEMLLQQRALTKYHSGGLWTNACCGHPIPGEEVRDAAQQRLKEEMGFNTDIQKAFSFIYKAAVSNGLTEYEVDHVFTGTFEGIIIPDISEVKEYCYMGMDTIREAIRFNPNKYTEWFKIAFPKLEVYLASKT